MSIRSEYFEYLKHIGRSVTVREFADKPAEPLVALRHDVDYDINVAMEMAFWEKEKECRSTFFLLHTADYWNSPQFIEKALQIQDFGHEIGLHVNMLSEWMRGNVDDVDGELKKILDQLRRSGLDISGMSPHGDPLCYERQFINHWCFEELKPDNPSHTESGLSAEGIAAENERYGIAYPPSHRLTREDKGEFALWSVSMEKLGLSYDAMHTSCDEYYTDSGGTWKRSQDPLEANLSQGRHQILVHPEHWRGPQKYLFFLSTARSGSKWLANFLNTATSVRAVHEFTLNHRFKEGKLIPEKRTGYGFSDLVSKKDEVRQLLIESRNWIETMNQDFAEANVYLERFLPILKEVFPEAVFVHVHRDPKDVVRSILNRDWYDTPMDKKHPEMEVEHWDTLSQFEKACWYVRLTNESLLDSCEYRIIFENMVQDIEYLSNILLSLGVIVFPRLGTNIFSEIVNANVNQQFPDYSEWCDEDKYLYHEIMGPVLVELGSTNAYEGASWGSDFGARSEKYVEKRRAARKRLLERRQKENEIENLANIDFRRYRPEPFFFVGCELSVVEDGLAIVPTRERHAFFVIGGGTWYELQDDKGWPHHIGTYVRGWLEAVCEGEGLFQLFCLMFDEGGAQIGKRSLGQFRQGDDRLEFSYRPLHEANRFTLAVFLDIKSLPARIVLERLVIEKVRG
jgi:hypothetical protein